MKKHWSYDPKEGVTLKKAHDDASVTIPLQRYLDLVFIEESRKSQSIDQTHKQEVEYIHAMLRDVQSGALSKDELQEFHFFNTPLGRFILLHWDKWTKFIP